MIAIVLILDTSFCINKGNWFMEKYKSCYTDSYARDGASGTSYDKGVSNRFELFIFKIEKRILLDIIQKTTDVEYLDYACGT